MEILVDDRPYHSTGSPDQTIRTLANEVCEATGGSGQRIVVALRCDGNEIAPEGLDAVLELPVNQFRRIDLQTQPAAALVRSTLAKAIELLDEAAGMRQHIADQLAQGQHNAAMQQLQNLIHIWQQVQQTMLVCAQTLGTDLEALRVNHVGLAEVMEPIKTQLNELKNGIENRDFVLVGDILRYELDDPLACWLALLNHLLELARTTDK